MSVCRSCGAPITWVPTAGKRNMPLDAEPNDQGNVTIQDGVAVVLAGRSRAIMIEEGATIYMPHFQSCSNPPARRR